MIQPGYHFTNAFIRRNSNSWDFSIHCNAIHADDIGIINPSQTSGFSQNFLINLDMFYVCSIAWDMWKPWS